MVRLQREPIETGTLLAWVRRDADGAQVLFCGTVRDSHAGRRVVGLEYHAYEPMALQVLQSLVQQTGDRFDVHRIGVVHRLGRLEVGEVSVAVAVGAPHRRPAFDAAADLMDRLKREVPIWKREIYADGAAWIEGGETVPSSEV